MLKSGAVVRAEDADGRTPSNLVRDMLEKPQYGWRPSEHLALRVAQAQLKKYELSAAATASLEEEERKGKRTTSGKGKRSKGRGSR